MKVSVIIPSRNCMYLKYLLHSLKEQIIKPHELILVIKNCDIKITERLCGDYNLPCIIVEQKRGFFTTALNIGKEAASGDIILFTDDDAIAPKGWIKRYVKAFATASHNVGCISSRDIYVALNEHKLILTADDLPQTKLYRWFVRTWLEPPLDVLKRYRYGVYIDRSLKVVHGPYLPDKACLSLPYRGVNMGFKGEVMDIVEFPEHPMLKRAPGNEQFAGLKIVLSGFDCLYIPNNPILHIYRMESLSRTKDEDLRRENKLMKSFYRELLSKSTQ